MARQIPHYPDGRQTAHVEKIERQKSVDQKCQYSERLDRVLVYDEGLVEIDKKVSKVDSDSQIRIDEGRCVIDS